MGDDSALRYSRHIGLPQLGAQGQQQLAQSSALIVGIGGLGATASLYLANSGLGRLVINDFDRVDATNLPRQILYRPEHVGAFKTDAASEMLQTWNPALKLTAINARLDDAGLAETGSGVDVVLDCSDNFATRTLINRVCVAAATPLVSGAAIRFEGQLAVFSNDRDDAPCYRCLYTEADENLENCAGQGILAPVAGTIGCMMATETIKVLTGLDSDLNGHLWLYDGLAGSSRTIRIRRRDDCPVCASRQG